VLRPALTLDGNMLSLRFLATAARAYPVRVIR